MTLNDTHKLCWEMLPWVVTGRISARDKQHVDRHLLECPECRAELEHQRSLCDLVAGDHPVMLAPQASLQKLMDRIDSDIRSGTDSDMTKDSHSPPRIPRWLSVAAAVQTIAIAVLLAALWQQHESELNAPRFSTLSTAAHSVEGPMLRVVFDTNMTNGDLLTLLRKIEGQVVAGPTEAGVYSVALAADGRTRDVATALKEVRDDPRVVFAELVAAEVQR